MAAETEVRRLDLPTGKVPDYRTFVRHLWTYRDPQGFEIGAPPIMYRAIFEESDADWRRVREIAQYVSEHMKPAGRIDWVSAGEIDGMNAWELRFRSLRSLHVFCMVLGDRARVQEDPIAIRVGEFIMWTLGFRWV